jgi:hypothetical protein
MFGLQGYVAEHHFTVTTLLIYRSLGNSSCVGNKISVIYIETPTEARRP